jgi:hypothetical protein
MLHSYHWFKNFRVGICYPSYNKYVQKGMKYMAIHLGFLSLYFKW